MSELVASLRTGVDWRLVTGFVSQDDKTSVVLFMSIFWSSLNTAGAKQDSCCEYESGIHASSGGRLRVAHADVSRIWFHFSTNLIMSGCSRIFCVFSLYGSFESVCVGCQMDKVEYSSVNCFAFWR